MRSVPLERPGLPVRPVPWVLPAHKVCKDPPARLGQLVRLVKPVLPVLLVQRVRRVRRVRPERRDRGCLPVGPWGKSRKKLRRALTMRLRGRA